MEKQMDLTESSGGQPPEKKRRGYGLLLRLIALVLVVALFVGMTSVDFSLVRYQGTDQMAAAQYLMDQTTYLQENRFERLKSLLTQLDSYSINLQAAERAIFLCSLATSERTCSTDAAWEAYSNPRPQKRSTTSPRKSRAVPESCTSMETTQGI